jgi:hypothetical protein
MEPLALRPTVLGVLGVLSCACASSRIPIYVAPSNDTVEAGTEMSLGGEGQNVYVFNHSSVTIMVTGLQLHDCENIKNRCDVMRLRIPVRPVQRQNLALVRPNDTNRPFSFKFNYSWEPARAQ